MFPKKRTSYLLWAPPVRTAVWLMAVVAVLATTTTASAAPDTSKLVAVIYPHFSDGAPGIVLTNRGIRTTFASKAPGRVEVRNEYVDVSRLQDAEFMRAQVAILQQKYAARKPDLVIAGLSSGLDFALAIRQDVFPNVPIVFTMVEQREVEARRLPSGVVGVPVRMDLTGTLDTALRLQPNTRQVFVITGSSTFDRQWETAARKEFGRYEDGLDFTYLAGLPMDELLGRVAELPKRSIIYYLHVFKDGIGQDFIPSEALERIAACANAAVYTHVDTFVDRGAVGGHVYMHETEGAIAARLGLGILAGESPESILVPAASENTYLFNDHALRRWQVSKHRLPSGSVVRFDKPTFWDQYRWHVIGVVSLCVLEAQLIAALLVHRWKRRRSDLALRESEARFRLMADAAPVLIWSSGTDKKRTYFNQSWLKFTGRPIEQQLGYGWADDVHPDDLKECLAEYDLGFDRREPFELMYRLRRHDGEYRWVLGRAAPRFTADGHFAGYISACIDVTERRRTEDALRASREELRRLAGQFIEAQEAERRRVARELHDDVSQGLALLSMEIDLTGQRPPASAAEMTRVMQNLSARARALTSRIHNLSHQLHPAKLEHLGLVAALRGLCKEVALHYGLEVEFDHHEVPERIPEAMAVCLFRIAQEALRNVIKHGQTDRVRVELIGAHDQLTLTVADYGVGFDPAARSDEGLGLVSMRERLALVHGRLEIDSRPGDGTRIIAGVPMPETDEALDEAPPTNQRRQPQHVTADSSMETSS